MTSCYFLLGRLFVYLFTFAHPLILSFTALFLFPVKGSAPADKANDPPDDVTPPANKRRVLPAWMMAAVAAPHGSRSSPEGSRRFTAQHVKHPERSCVWESCRPSVTFLSVLVQGGKRPAAKKAETPSPEEEELNEEEMPKKRRKKTHGDEDTSQVRRE